MNKIEALKKTVSDLVNGKTEYDWYNHDQCNCGVVAKTLLDGETASENGYWKSPIKGEVGAFARSGFCLTTNLSLPKVFQVLKDAGFTYQDLLELEFLGNKEVVEEMKLNNDEYLFNRLDGVNFLLCGDSQLYSKKEYLIAYLQSWVRILKCTEAPRERVIYKTVVIDRSVKELQERVMILN